MKSSHAKSYNRESERRFISSSEQIQAAITIGNFSLRGFLIDSSVGGLGIKVHCTESDMQELGRMQHHLFQIEIMPSGLPSFKTKAKLLRIKGIESKSQPHYFNVTCGFSIEDKKVNREKSKARFPFKETLRPTFSFENSVFYYELVYGLILEASSKAIHCETSARNKNIIPGMKVRLQINIPLFGNTACDAIVLNYKINPLDPTRGKVEFKINSNEADFQSRLASLILINNPGVSPSLLKKEGFFIESYLKGASLEYAKSLEEKDEIALLRWIAWRDKDENFKNLLPIDMFDKFDKNSRHLVIRMNGKMISTSRLVYNNGDRDACEHLSYGAEIPQWLWDFGFVETSRLVTHPEYRGSDIFLAMTQFIGRTVTQSGYRYMVSSCEESLEPIYISSGCKRLSKFNDADGGTWCLLVMDLRDTGLTKSMDPISWNIVHSKNTNYMIERGYFNPTWIEKIRLFIYRQFTPLANWLMKKKFSKRNRK